MSLTSWSISKHLSPFTLNIALIAKGKALLDGGKINLTMSQFKSYAHPNQGDSAGINKTLHLYPAQVGKKTRREFSTSTRGSVCCFRKLGHVDSEIPQILHKQGF